MSERIQKVADLIVEVDEGAVEVVRGAVAAGVDPEALLREGVIRGLERIGKKFEDKEYFLGELMMGGQIAEECITIIDPHLPLGRGDKLGTVVIGAVSGDLHDIGYSLVAKQLELSGFEVHSMGVNVEPMAFIDKAREVGADVIGLSAFLVTTILNCRDTVDYRNDMGLRDDFKIIIGGAETDQEKADMIGADGWAPNAVEAVELCKRICEERRETRVAS